MRIGERIKHARQERGITVAALAEASGLTKGFISQLESGRSNGSLASLGRVAAALDLPLSLLVSEPSELSTAPAQPVLLRSSLLPDAEGLRAIASGQSGALVLGTLKAGSSLDGGSAHAGGVATPTATCAVLRGVVALEQGGSVLTVAQGELAAWDASRAYSIANSAEAAATVLLTLPPSADAPLLHARPVSPPASLRLGVGVEGPLRLVAMRSARAAERKR